MTPGPSLHIMLGDQASSRDARLPLTADSCWANLLGRWNLPATGAIDMLARAIESMPAPPERCILRGCPSACLLPILWLRTIWLPPEARIAIEWDQIDDPSDQPGRQAAGRLACLLASEVRCADPARAGACWGYCPQEPGQPASASGEAFDLLNNLIDTWGLGSAHHSPAGTWAQAVRRELLSCAALGMKRVAIYGAGTHTRAVGEVLMEPDVEIAAIIDDDARRHGTRLWGYPIVSPDAALTLNLDAIILSANSVEDLLWERTARHRDAGIRVIRLYGGQKAGPSLPLRARLGLGRAVEPISAGSAL
jgi:hypothetical protein